MLQQQWMSLLGLAFRARKVISGEELVVGEIRKQKAKLVLLSADASSHTQKKIINKCKYYKIPFRLVPSREQLGRSIGKSERVVVAILDEGFAKKLESLLDE